MIHDYYRECAGTGLTLLDYKSQPAGYGLYKFINCGHTQLIQYVHVRNGGFSCKTCKAEYFSDIYKRAGVELLDSSSNNRNNKIIKLACGHIAEKSLQSIKTLEFECKECRELEWKRVAKGFNLEIVGKGSGNSSCIYKLPCGHTQEIQRNNVKLGNFRCFECGNSSVNKKSYLYLLKIVSKRTPWLKIGYSSDVDRRIKQYGLFDDAVVTKLRIVELNSRKLAAPIEVSIHKRLKGYALNSEEMEAYMLNGYTECYKHEHLDVILKIFDEEVSNYE